MNDLKNSGIVKFFNESKGYGFIIDLIDHNEYFFHFTKVLDSVKKDDKVSFNLESGKRGFNAINVKKL